VFLMSSHCNTLFLTKAASSRCYESCPLVDVRDMGLSISVGQTGVVRSSVTCDRVTQSARDIVVGHVGMAVTMVTFCEHVRAVMSLWTCDNSESISQKKNVGT
jgi:hypothetical protein